MSLTSENLLAMAQAGHYAVGAFNANNMEIVQAIGAAASAEAAPVYVQASKGAIKYAGLDYIAALVRTMAEEGTSPVVLHLDHGDYETAIKCINSGMFQSVMFDGSEMSWEDNVRVTQDVVRAAREKGVLVEAEIGRVGGVEDDISASEEEARYSTVEEAIEFVKKTEVDSLAVAIGTAHGVYKKAPDLKFDLIEEIAAAVPNTPLVMHGSSGVPEDSIKRAVSLGMCKINIDTDIRQVFVEKMAEIMAADPSEIDPRKILGPAREAAAAIIQEKIRMFGSAGKGV